MLVYLDGIPGSTGFGQRYPRFVEFSVEPRQANLCPLEFPSADYLVFWDGLAAHPEEVGPHSSAFFVRLARYRSSTWEAASTATN